MISAGQMCFSDHTVNTSFNLDRTESTIFPFDCYKHTVVASPIQSLNLSFFAITTVFPLSRFWGWILLLSVPIPVFSHTLSDIY